MGKRLAVALLGAVFGGLIGWTVAALAGLSFFAVTIGILAGGLIALAWAQKRGKVQTVDELHKLLSISPAERHEKP
jgi:outer membrane lipoprotein SlyB